MSYYAEGKGFIKFKFLPYKAEQAVRDVFGKNKAFCIEPHSFEPDAFTISFDGRYDEVEEMLNQVAEIADIEEGYIEFTGEEWGAFWRFIWIDGKWVCQDGKVVYG